MRHRSWLIPLCVASVLLLAVALPVQAGDTILIPLRWCALDGTPAVTNPMGAPTNPFTGDPEPDTDSVLWRRHERATDNIWTPGADITFRSGITAAIKDNANFPIIPDPCPPTNVTLCQGGSTAGMSCTPDGTGGSPDCDAGISCATQACPAACTTGCPGQLGDVFDPNARQVCQGGANPGTVCTPNAAGQDPATCGAGIACGDDVTEYNLAVSACSAAWDALTGAISTNLLGQTAVNIGVWRNLAGNRTGLKGRAQWSTFDGNSCAIPPTGVTMATGGAILAIDNQNFVPSDVPFEPTNERMVAHELGHSLQLGHGDGLDNEPDSVYDQLCDGDENTCAAPTTFMSSTACGSLTTAMTANQRNTARALAGVYSGVTIDPPGTLVPGPTVGDQRSDTPLDITDRSVDMVWVAMQENTGTGMTSFSHALFGLIPFLEGVPTRQYVVFADLDGNPATGGDPASLGFNTAFQGAELVTRVVVGVSGGEIPIQFAAPTLWRFQGGSFVECTTASDPLCTQIVARLFEVLGGDDSPDEDGTPPRPVSHVVSIEMPNAIRGAVAAQVRIQAIAEQQVNGGALDRLPDEPLDGAKLFLPVPPVFPECVVMPDPVPAGTTATVEATGLIENRMAKVFLGDRRVATGTTDAAGNASLSFQVPPETPLGRRLVTVGVVETALTADCTVVVQEAPPVPTCFGVPATIIGTDGSDALNGMPGDDVIVGLGGNDAINSRGGNNLICGGDGNDAINTGAGDDKINGDAGNDAINAGVGNDILNGGVGNDTLNAGAGNDMLDGGPGFDTLNGGPGSDTCINGELNPGCP
jgi:hypothetical protein